MTTRTHFTFRVDTWSPDGESIVEHTSPAWRTTKLRSRPTAPPANAGRARRSPCGRVRESSRTVSAFAWCRRVRSLTSSSSQFTEAHDRIVSGDTSSGSFQRQRRKERLMHRGLSRIAMVIALGFAAFNAATALNAAKPNAITMAMRERPRCMRRSFRRCL